MSTLRPLACTAALAASLLAPHSDGQASYNILYAFSTSGVTEEPEGVIAGQNGALYGISAGYTNPGTVFELQRAGNGKWTETVLHAFTGSPNDGANGWSHAVPVLDAQGDIFGTTTNGGTYGFGTVFELQPPVSSGPWIESILYNFTSGFGISNVVLGANGVLYGVNSGGGTFGQGMVFQLAPPAPGKTHAAGAWTFKALYNFSGGGDGASPVGLTLGPQSTLYGTAGGGGRVGEGVIFQLTPPAKSPGVWTESVLYSFLGGEAGASPFGSLVLNENGSLYGATSTSVFLLTPPAGGAASFTPWTETMVHNFWGDPAGGPDSALIVRNGVIYGTISPLVCICTCSGGAIYQLSPGSGSGPWSMTVLHRLYENNEPFGTLVIDQGGALFGTTLQGPGFVGNGVLYRVDPSSTDLEHSNDDPPPCGVCCDMRNAVSSRRH